MSTAQEIYNKAMYSLLNTVHQRNVDNALNGQIELIELITKSMEK